MSRTRGRVSWSIVAIAVTVVLAGCSGVSVQESPDGHIIVVAGEATDAHPQALIEGTAEWGDGGCLVIRADETYLVIFPYGTTMDDNDDVMLPSGHQLRAGDDVALGGGFHELDAIESDLSSIPDACLSRAIFSASGEVSK